MRFQVEECPAACPAEEDFPLPAKPLLRHEPFPPLPAAAPCERPRLVEEERSPQEQLTQRLRAVQQQASQRWAAVQKLQEDTRRMDAEAAEALRNEERVLRELSGLALHTASTEEAFRSQQATLIQRLHSLEPSESRWRSREREWSEELDSMTQQQARLVEEVSDLKHKLRRWQRTATESNASLSQAKGRLKTLEQQHADAQAQGAALRQQMEADKETALEEAVETGELKQKLAALDSGPSWREARLQALVLALWILILWLLVAK